MLGVQDRTRPSALVVPLNVSVVDVKDPVLVLEALCKVKVTGMEDAGRPIVVSRTWHVIGGLGASVAMFDFDWGGERWFVSAVRRVCGVCDRDMRCEMDGWMQLRTRVASS